MFELAVNIVRRLVIIRRTVIYAIDENKMCSAQEIHNQSAAVPRIFLLFKCEKCHNSVNGEYTSHTHVRNGGPRQGRMHARVYSLGNHKYIWHFDRHSCARTACTAHTTDNVYECDEHTTKHAASNTHARTVDIGHCLEQQYICTQMNTNTHTYTHAWFVCVCVDAAFGIGVYTCVRARSVR